MTSPTAIVAYVSGPMSGYVEYNVPAFVKATAYLRQMGWTVVSPHEQAADQGSEPWESYLHRDLSAMLAARCNTLVLLPGWPESKGARAELDVALTLGMTIYFLRDDACRLTRMSRA